MVKHLHKTQILKCRVHEVVWTDIFCLRIFSSAVSKYKKVIYETIILPVVLYVCETWSLTLREEHRLRVFEKRVLRRIFGPKKDEVTGGWRKLHNKELHNVYSKSRRMDEQNMQQQ
jgi:hypothetical protein